jgi:hypothetical protein
MEPAVSGSAYSAAHASHIVKPAMVVFGRSYGSARMMLKRGPQFVQFVKA